MKNKKIAITGHTGVIGSDFVKKFKKNKFVKCKIDIADKKKVYKWIEKNDFDIFIHFAAIVPINQVDKDKKRAFKVNFQGTKNIVDGLVKYKKGKKIWFFFSSTSHVYQQTKKKIKIRENHRIKPQSFYGYSKRLAEEYIVRKLSKNKIDFCIGRIFSFTHYKQKEDYFVPMVFKKILQKNKSELYFDRVNTYRDFISINDLLRSINILFQLKKRGIFNIAAGQPVDLKNIIYLVSKIVKNKKKILILNKKINFNLVANVFKLKKLNFIPKHSIDDILKNFYKLKYKKKL